LIPDVPRPFWFRTIALQVLHLAPEIAQLMFAIKEQNASLAA
jgi:hypothetical protein